MLPTGNHTSTLIWLHGIAENCAMWETFLLALQSTSMKTICVEAPIIPVTAEFDLHPAGKIEIRDEFGRTQNFAVENFYGNIENITYFRCSDSRMV